MSIEPPAERADPDFEDAPPRPVRLVISTAIALGCVALVVWAYVHSAPAPQHQPHEGTVLQSLGSLIGAVVFGGLAIVFVVAAVTAITTWVENRRARARRDLSRTSVPTARARFARRHE